MHRATSRRALFALLIVGGLNWFAALSLGQTASEPLSPKEAEALKQKMLRTEARIHSDTDKQTGPKILVGPDLSEREKVIQVLSRMSFGPRPGQVDEVLKAGGWQVWVKQQLAPDSIDDSELEQQLISKYTWYGKTDINEVRKDYPEGYSKKGAKKRNVPKGEGELAESVVLRAALSKRQFKEVMCEFWRNHFFVDQPEGDDKQRIPVVPHYEDQVIRKNVFGVFGNMLFASATHPAMLEYLDNQLSRANNWNENYAREVMELHTLGADHYYNELDVRELAKILTGWRYDDDSYQFAFEKKWHQPGPKMFLGMNVAEGYNGGEQALYVLATHHGTADYVSEKLCRFLVNDNPPPALVKKVANVFRQSKGDLPKVYAAIVMSPEFLSRENYRAKFKTPFFFTISALRSTNANIQEAGEVCHVIARMGQPIYNCADPTGYRDQAESWMDAGVLTTRWDFAWNLVRGKVDGVTVPQAFMDQYAALKSPQLEQKMTDDLVGADIGDREHTVLGEAAAAGEIDRMLGVTLGSPSFQQR